MIITWIHIYVTIHQGQSFQYLFEINTKKSGQGIYALISYFRSLYSIHSIKYRVFLQIIITSCSSEKILL